MAKDHAIVIGTILSHRTNEGMVEITINGEKAQLDLTKAREVHRNLGGAIEAAISDQLIFQFLTTRIGIEPAKAASVLLDFRELRQGTRDTVFPT